MACPVCHAANEADARFCERCGQPFGTLCTACGSRAQVDARFCRMCGQNLVPPANSPQPSDVQPPPPEHLLSRDEKLAQLQRYVPRHLTDKILASRGRLEGERKLVTVLFADLAGYTVLSEQLGEEALFALMDDLYERFIHEIYRYEGTVNELTGDGLVAFFGAPLAVEQAPQRAVRAALALQQAAARFSTRLEHQHSIGLQLRIGINTGPVIVGSIGNNLRMDYKAVGNTVNLAARMEQTATPGTIQITEQTYRLVEGYVDCEPLGLVHLKGIATKVRAYRVMGERDARAPIDVAQERGFTPLVGRERELALLRHGFDLAKSGRGQAVSIIGDAGLGKSRLLYECRQALADEDVTWVDGRCHPYGVALAYLPIVELLKQFFRIDANDWDEDITRKVHHELTALQVDLEATAPYLLHLLAPGVDGGLPAGLPPDAVKHRTFEALQGLVLAEAARRPLVLTLEDLHWVDNATEELVTFLLEHIAGARILLVCTYRPDFATTWSRKSYHHVISLTRLEPRESYRMLTSLLGTAQIQDSLATLVLDKAEGVPFFLEELVKSLRETDAIERHAGQWRLIAEASAVQVPDTVEEMLMARIDRLPEGAKGVLQLGSVIGREFGWALLRELAGLAEHELAAYLAALTEAELLYARGLPPQTTYLFKHAFTQEAVYRGLLTARRRELHHRVAVTLEVLFPDRLDEQAGQLAHHYLEAGPGDDVDKAVEHALRAGKRHTALPAYAEAARFYHMALEALAPQQPAQDMLRCQLLLELGDAQRNAGEHFEAMETFQRAADLARTLHAPESLARAAVGFEEVRWRPGLPGELSTRLLEEALSVLPEGDSALRARVLAGLTSALSFTGARERASAIGQQAIEMAHRIGDAATLAATLNLYLFVLRGQLEKLDERLAYATEILHLAKKAGDVEIALGAHVWQIIDLLEAGDVQTLDVQLEAYARLAHEMRQPHFLYMVASHRAMRALLHGRFEAAEQLAEEAFAIGQRLQAEGIDGTFGIQMFTLRREQGRLHEVAPAVRHFVRQHGAASAWRPGLALIYSELGREREARTEFERLATHEFADVPQDDFWITCMTYIAEVCVFLSDAPRAATLYQLLLPYDGHNVVVGGAHVCYGPASRYLGMLATTMNRWQEAERHFEDALAMNAHMDARPWLAHTQHDYARMLLARHQPGDGEKATRLLHEALALARELGMRALSDRITGRTDQRTAPAPMPVVDLDDLSPREIEVLRLLAAGRSNREIAATLCISLNTVATHVRNIFTKTGVTNRTEAAAYAIRHGLPET